MSACSLDGVARAEEILREVAEEAGERERQGLPQPRLAAVLVGDGVAVEYQLRAKQDVERVRMAWSGHPLRVESSTEEVVALVKGLNQDRSVSGILVQMPLPPQIDQARVVREIDPLRDVDAVHPLSQGRLLLGQAGLAPCTCAAVLELLERIPLLLDSARAVILGDIGLISRPLCVLLSERMAAVTLCPGRGPDVGSITRDADVVVLAVGRPGSLTRDMVKPGAAVIDLSVNRIGHAIVGDAAEDVAEVAGWLTPVPGGVDPMSRAMLVRNTLLAERARNR